MDERVLHYALLDHEDQADYMCLVNTPRWREKAEEYLEKAQNPPPFGSRSQYGYFLYWAIILIRGRYFRYDQKRAASIQQFLKDMQVKYDCDSLDQTDFPGGDRWQ